LLDAEDLINILDSQLGQKPANIGTELPDLNMLQINRLRLESIENPFLVYRHYTIYTIKQNDTLIGIANTYGVSWENLQKINSHIQNPGSRKTGEALIVPKKLDN
jgi:spore germination protein YaaH